MEAGTQPEPRADASLNGAAAVSARSTWAVGINSPGGKTLILRWNGKAWKLS